MMAGASSEERRMSIRVLLADGHALVLAALEPLLAARFVVLASASDGDAALELTLRLLPDVLLLEFSLPGLDGLALVRALRVQAPTVRCVFVTSRTDLGSVRAAFAAGAVGYVAKHAAPEALYEAVERASRGETYVNPGFGLGASEVPPRSLTHGCSGGLTMRQREVLGLVAAGKTGKEIAARLGITLKTVETHRAGIARQLGLHSPAGFTRYAVQHDLMAPPESASAGSGGRGSRGPDET
jgi:DNA-binding NarL/FixJ family response regulator